MWPTHKRARLPWFKKHTLFSVGHTAVGAAPAFAKLGGALATVCLDMEDTSGVMMFFAVELCAAVVA